jgi:hypothetical protein
MIRTIEVSDETWDKIKDQISEDEVFEVNGMEDLVGKKWAFQCARYIYFGKVKSINSDFIELDKAQVVFDTGDYSNTSPNDAQDLPKKKAMVMRQSIESIYPTNW